MTSINERRVTCRYLDRLSNRCTGEVVEFDAEIDLCIKHLARAAELIHRRQLRLGARSQIETCKHVWPDELGPDVRCERCGLTYGTWS